MCIRDRYKKAIKDYDRTIELDPEFAMAYYHRGICYRNLGQHEKSIEDHSKAIELDPDNAHA